MAFPSTPGGQEKKGSIFGSLSPQAPAAAPAAAPAPAQRSAAPEELGALKQKLDGLEKRIMEQLTAVVKGAAQQPPPPPPPPAAPRPQADPALASKLEALEKRLSEFAQQSTVAGSMLKNIEESKIAARREIEDLLKAVREQQKYSELDREIHDQLDKSWKRVEETERKLMDFYSSLMAAETRRRAETEVMSRHAGEDARALAAGLKALEARLGGIEERLVRYSEDASPEKSAKMVREFTESLAEGRRAIEASAADTAARMAAQTGGLADQLRQAAQESLRRMEDLYGAERRRLEEKNAAFAEEFGRRMAAALEEQGRRTAGALEEQARRTAAAAEEQARRAAERDARTDERFAGLRRAFEEGVAGELKELRRGFEETLAAERRESAARAAELDGKVAEFARLAAENKVKADGVEAALAAAAARIGADVASLTAGAVSEMKTAGVELAAKVREESAARFEALGAKYADAMLSLSFMDSFFASVDASQKKMAEAGAGLEELLRGLDRERLAALTGVSGEVAREKIAAVEELRETLAADAARLAGIRGKLAERLKEIFPERKP